MRICIEQSRGPSHRLAESIAGYLVRLSHSTIYGGRKRGDMAEVFAIETPDSLEESGRERESEKAVHAVPSVTIHAADARFSRLHSTAGYPM
jgi:hypothetical protein